MSSLAEQFTQALIARMSIGPRERILDAGCGEGRLSRVLATLVPEGLVVGLDASSDAVYAARVQSASVENLMFVWGEAESIPWKEEFFSRVICVDALPYFADPGAALAEIHRVLSPGASLWVLNQLPKAGAPSRPNTTDANPPLRQLNAEDYRSLFEQYGFREILSQTLAAPASAANAGHVPMTNVLLMTAIKPVI